MSSKNSELQTAANTKLDLQSKLSGLENSLQAANSKNRLLATKLEETKVLLGDAEE